MFKFLKDLADWMVVKRYVMETSYPLQSMNLVLILSYRYLILFIVRQELRSFFFSNVIFAC